MDRDDIIRMAREAGIPVFENGITSEDPKDQPQADAVALFLQEAAVRFFEVAYAAGATAERKRCIDILRASYIIDDGENHAQLVIDRINND